MSDDSKPDQKLSHLGAPDSASSDGPASGSNGQCEANNPPNPDPNEPSESAQPPLASDPAARAADTMDPSSPESPLPVEGVSPPATEDISSDPDSEATKEGSLPTSETSIDEHHDADDDADESDTAEDVNASTDDAFDFNAPIKAPGADAFSDLVSDEDHAAAIKAGILDASRSLYANPDAFEQFDQPGETFEPGTTKFTIEETDFTELCSVLGTCIYGKDKQGLVKFTLARRALRAQVLSPSTFVEFIVPAECAIPTLNNDDRVTFTVLFEELLQSRDAIQGPIEFHLTITPAQMPGHLPHRSLWLRTSDFERPLTLSDQLLSSIWLDGEMGALNPNERILFNAANLRAPLAAVSIVAEKNELARQWDVVELRDGHLIGGTDAAIALIDTPSLAELALRIRVQFIAPLGTALSLCGERTALLQTPRFYVIRGERIAFGFEKHPQSFPNLDHWFEGLDVVDRIRVPKEPIHRACVAALDATDGRSRTVRIKARGSGQSRIRLEVRGADGRNLKVGLDAFRDGPDAPVTVAIDNKKLAAIAYIAKSTNLDLCIFDKFVLCEVLVGEAVARFLLTTVRRQGSSRPLLNA